MSFRTDTPVVRLRAAALLLALAAVLTATLGGVATAEATTGGVSIASSSASKTASTSRASARAASSGARPRSVSRAHIRLAQTLLRTSITGSNDSGTRKVVRRFQRLREMDPHGIIDVATYRQIKDSFALLNTGGLAVDAAGAEAGGAVITGAPAEPVLPDNLAAITAAEREILERIAECESGGDPRIVSSSGRYFGKYQFSLETWASVGGDGKPSDATEVEQDQRAAILLRQRGTSPWPVCSQR